MPDNKSKVYSFFIFNSSFGPNEGDELKKILYFYPAHTSADSRKNQVGLCEAVIKFMSSFSSEPCEALQTQNKRHIFYQPEKGFWMIMIVNIPYSTKSSRGTQSEEMIEPTVIQNFLMSAYNMFKMFMGPLTDIPVDELPTKCTQFFMPYISSTEIINDIPDVIKGVQYLALDKNSFFKIMCFIDLVEVEFPDFKCSTFIYNDQLIWNGLSTEDMITMHQYLTLTLLPDQVKKEIQGGPITSAQRHGRFISPPEGIHDEEDVKKISIVYLSRENDMETKKYHLVIYRTLSATVCFTVDANINLELDSLKALDAFIGSQLSGIASTISEQCASQALQNALIANSETKFVYFNRLNLAYRSSFPSNKLVPSASVKPEVLRILADMHADRKSLGEYGEIVIKTPDEYWITGKTSNEKEFYVIQQKNANLKDVADEARRVCESQLKGVFFYPK